jgi:hypothetical protein
MTFSPKAKKEKKRKGGAAKKATEKNRSHVLPQKIELDDTGATPPPLAFTMIAMQSYATPRLPTSTSTARGTASILPRCHGCVKFWL